MPHVPDSGARPLMAAHCLPLPGQRKLPLWIDDPRWWLFGYLAVAVNTITLFILGVDLFQAQVLAMIPIVIIAEVVCRMSGGSLFLARLTVPRLLTRNTDPPSQPWVWPESGPRLA